MELQTEFVVVSIWISKQDIFVRTLSSYFYIDLYGSYIDGTYMEFQAEFIVVSIWISKQNNSTTRQLPTSIGIYTEITLMDPIWNSKQNL